MSLDRPEPTTLALDLALAFHAGPDEDREAFLAIELEAYSAAWGPWEDAVAEAFAAHLDGFK